MFKKLRQLVRNCGRCRVIRRRRVEHIIRNADRLIRLGLKRQSMLNKVTNDYLDLVEIFKEVCGNSRPSHYHHVVNTASKIERCQTNMAIAALKVGWFGGDRGVAKLYNSIWVLEGHKFNAYDETQQNITRLKDILAKMGHRL